MQVVIGKLNSNLYQGNSWGMASSPPTMRLESTLDCPQNPVEMQIEY
jgi:hypothetical protein